MATAGILKIQPKFTEIEFKNKQFSVVISAAESPSNIYFQVLDEQFDEHQRMMKEFHEKMDYVSKHTCCQQIKLGLICAVKYCRNWLRALFEKLFNGDMLLMFFVDTGIRSYIKRSECFKLPENLTDHSAQATRCMLNEIGPFKPKINDKWLAETIKKVKDLRNVKAKIFINDCHNGEVGRIGKELTCFVTLYLEEQLQISFNDHLYNLSLVISCKKSIRQPVIITEYSTGAHSLAVTHSSAAAHPNVIKESSSVPHSSAATQTLVKSAVKPKPVAHL